MRVLGIETTCDETACAVIEDGAKILSNVVYSQCALHKKYNGVVPEIASRAHCAKIAPVIKQAIDDAGLSVKKRPFDLISFASGPGLPGALLVGKVSAQVLGGFYGAEIVPVNHLEGHLFACEIDGSGKFHKLEFPLIALIVSGGHTELWLVKNYGKYKLLGATRDDAAGEAFDKVAKLLKLGYPGGPAVEKCALDAGGSPVKFPRPYMEGSWDFSFSGLKTAVSYYLRDNKKFSPADVCYGFQEAATDVLVAKTILAAKKFGVGHIALGGGVSANSVLRRKMAETARKDGIRARFVEKKFCTDNAVMIALAGYRKKMSARLAGSLKINPNMRVESWR